MLRVDRVEGEDIFRVLVGLVSAETEAELSNVFEVEVGRLLQPDIVILGPLDLLRVVKAEEVDPTLPEPHIRFVLVVLDPVVGTPCLQDADAVNEECRLQGREPFPGEEHPDRRQ